MSEPRNIDVHTCHSECPCQTGGGPMRDFLPGEGSWLALWLLLREQVGNDAGGSDDE